MEYTAIFSPPARKKSVSDKHRKRSHIYLKANIKRRFSYSYCAYLRRNTHSHGAAVKNYYSVTDTEIAVTARVYNNFPIRFAVTDKKPSTVDFQNNRTHCHHSSHPLILDSYEYHMPQSFFSESCNINTLHSPQTSP